MAKKLSSARAAKLSRNPGTRSKVPTSQLSPAHRRTRLLNKRLDDPAELTKPLTPRGLSKQVTAAQDLQYSGPERELQGQQKQSNAIQTSIPSWFAQYQGALQAASQQTKATYAAAAAGQQNAVNSSSALDAQQQQGMQSQMSQDAASRGATVDPAIAQMAQQASASRRAAGDAQTGLTLGLGAANVGYRAGQQVVGAQQQVKAHIDEAQRSRGISKKRGELAKDRGAYGVKTRQGLIDAEHTKQLERKAFGLNEQKAVDDVRVEGAKLAQKRSDARRRSTDSARALGSRESIAAADRASREQEGALTRQTRRITAQTIASSGVTPAEKRRRNTAVAKAEGVRSKAVDYARMAASVKVKGQPGIRPAELRLVLDKKYPSAPREAIDYAMAAALGRKAGVTKKGQPTAAARYRTYLKKLSTGDLAG